MNRWRNDQNTMISHRVFAVAYFQSWSIREFSRTCFGCIWVLDEKNVEFDHVILVEYCGYLGRIDKQEWALSIGAVSWPPGVCLQKMPWESTSTRYCGSLNSSRFVWTAIFSTESGTFLCFLCQLGLVEPGWVGAVPVYPRTVRCLWPRQATIQRFKLTRGQDNSWDFAKSNYSVVRRELRI